MAAENTTTDDIGKASISLEEWAELEFEPWSDDVLEKIPTNREWADLADPHLVSVRLAMVVLTKTKAELVKIAESEDDPSPFSEELLDRFDRSERWYQEAVDVISSARARLLSAASVVALRDAA